MPVALLPAVRPATLAIVLGWASAIALVLWVVFAYNRLVRARLLAREGWSGVDVQLRRRHDLIPRLVETVAGYARFEREVLGEIAELRADWAAARHADRDLQQRENAVVDRLGGLLAVVEDYPELKADRGFLELQRELVEVEDQLQMARRYYNGAVRDYSIRRESFPSNLVAHVFSFEPEEFFEVQSASERLAPRVLLGGSGIAAEQSQGGDR